MRRPRINLETAPALICIFELVIFVPTSRTHVFSEQKLLYGYIKHDFKRHIMAFDIDYLPHCKQERNESVPRLQVEIAVPERPGR